MEKVQEQVREQKDFCSPLCSWCPHHQKDLFHQSAGWTVTRPEVCSIAGGLLLVFIDQESNKMKGTGDKNKTDLELGAAAGSEKTSLSDKGSLEK